jgi:prevent-host-death family protein
MIEITEEAANAQFRDLVERASKGEVFVITRDGRPIAHLTPVRQDRLQHSGLAEDRPSVPFGGNVTRFGADERARWAEHPYPCTIVADRYTGVYSGGRWIAYPLQPDDIPWAVEGDDSTCSEFWWDRNADDRLIPVGRGDTPMQAHDDLVRVMRGGEPNTPLAKASR